MDAEALERAAARYGDSVYRVALQATKSPADAEDVLQEVLLERWRTDTRFESDEHERRWLLRVAVNKSRNILRGRKWTRFAPLEDAMEVCAPDAAPDRALFDAVRALPEHQRLAVDLYYYEGYTTAEIAQILGAREATVRTWLHRGRNKLRTFFTEDTRDEGT